MQKFVFVGSRSEFPVGRARVVTVEGIDVAVFRLGQRFFALKNACPHMGFALGDGKLDGTSVICHGHGWRFDLETGQAEGRRSCATVWEVRLEGEDVLLRPPPEAEPRDDDELEDWVFWEAERYFKRKDGSQ